MIQLNFNFDNRQISSKVKNHKKEKNVTEYEMITDDEMIVKEFGNSIIFVEKDEFFGYKDSENKQGEKAIELLFTFKSALNWFRDKQPDLEI